MSRWVIVSQMMANRQSGDQGIYGGLASWRRTKLRRAAGCLLVALAPVRDLLIYAKHLFVARRIGKSKQTGRKAPETN